jgi:hypothetical protein
MKNNKVLVRCCSIAAILAILIGCSGPQPASSTSGSTASAPASIEKKGWYEGGNLHRALIGEWKAATYENRLVTSSDMVANLNKFSSVEEMKTAATELEQCVSKAAEGAQTEQQRVSEVAAACALLLGYR